MNVQTQPSASMGSALTSLEATCASALWTLSSTPQEWAASVRPHHILLGVIDLHSRHASDTCARVQTLALGAASWTSVPAEMPRRAWNAPTRSELVLPRRPAAVHRAGAGGVHVNRAPLSTPVSPPPLNMNTAIIKCVCHRLSSKSDDQTFFGFSCNIMHTFKGA